ncbi:DUF2877 domain-containing protein [Cardiobacteriaceae bacterium TAE3-ERU3]|nr:DUF2877 domain-containing protein [Cardiobacteriaceae bacterium TAE3-ERU3]
MSGLITMMDREIASSYADLDQDLILISAHRHVINFHPVNNPDKVLALVDEEIALGPRQLRCRNLPVADAEAIRSLIARSWPQMFSCALRLPVSALNVSVVESAWLRLSAAAAEAPDAFSRQIQKHLQHAIVALLAALQHPHPFRDDIDSAVSSLIGLGGGLTPSGDDFLSGLLVAMHLQSSPLSQHLALLQTAVQRYLNQTHVISAAFISDAVLAQVSSTVQEFVDCLHDSTVEQQRVQASLSSLTDLGHRSGYDLLSGLLAGLPFLHNRSTALCPYIAS